MLICVNNLVEFSDYINDTINTHHSSEICSSFFDMAVLWVSVALMMEGGRGT